MIDSLPILSGAVQSEPFPHLQTDEFFPPSMFDALLDSYPGEEYFSGIPVTQGGRQDLGRWNPALSRFLARTPPWQTFYDLVQSPDFVAQFVSKFHDDLKRLSLIDVEDWQYSRAVLGYEGRFKRRYRQLLQRTKLGSVLNRLRGDQLAVSFSINKSRTGYDSPPHIDTRHKLGAMLVYFTEPKLDKGYGALQLFKRRDQTPYSVGMLRDGFADQHFKLDVAREITTKPNSGILFLNTPEAWHGAAQSADSIESPLGTERRFVYISIAEKILANAWR